MSRVGKTGSMPRPGNAPEGRGTGAARVSLWDAGPRRAHPPPLAFAPGARPSSRLPGVVARDGQFRPPGAQGSPCGCQPLRAQKHRPSCPTARTAPMSAPAGTEAPRRPARGAGRKAAPHQPRAACGPVGGLAAQAAPGHPHRRAAGCAGKRRPHGVGRSRGAEGSALNMFPLSPDRRVTLSAGCTRIASRRRAGATRRQGGWRPQAAGPEAPRRNSAPPGRRAEGMHP